MFRGPPPSQSGGVALIAALWMGVALSCLMVLDIGHLFWQQRELQKIADLAALAGAAQDPTDCPASAQAIADMNGRGTSDGLVAEPGRWAVDPAKPASDFFTAGGSGANACRVQVTRQVPYFFVFSSMGSSSRKLFAQATALKQPNLARVLVRSSLLTLDSSQSALLNAIVGGLLGGKITLDALSWNSLAKANIELVQFLDALAVRAGLQVGNYDQILATPITMGQLTLAMADVLPRQGNAVAIEALQSLALQVGSVKLAVGDLFKFGTGLGQSALEASVNALDLVTMLAQLSNSQQAAGVDVALDLLLAKVGVQLKVIEPPQSLIGDPGHEAVEVKTSQIHLRSSIALDLVGVAGVSLKLGVDLGQGHAAVTGFACEGGSKSLSVVAQSGVGTIFLTGEVSALFSLIQIPISISLPLLSTPKQLNYQSPALPRLDEPDQQIDWQHIEQRNLVESLITELSKSLGPLGTLLEAVLLPVTKLLDALVNLLLGVLGVNLGEAEIGAKLSCNPSAELVF